MIKGVIDRNINDKVKLNKNLEFVISGVRDVSEKLSTFDYLDYKLYELKFMDGTRIEVPEYFLSMNEK